MTQWIVSTKVAAALLTSAKTRALTSGKLWLSNPMATNSTLRLAKFLLQPVAVKVGMVSVSWKMVALVMLTLSMLTQQHLPSNKPSTLLVLPPPWLVLSCRVRKMQLRSPACATKESSILVQKICSSRLMQCSAKSPHWMLVPS